MLTTATRTGVTNGACIDSDGFAGLARQLNPFVIISFEVSICPISECYSLATLKTYVSMEHSCRVGIKPSSTRTSSHHKLHISLDSCQ